MLLTMQMPPRVESIPCPTCHAFELKPREEGLGAVCSACGQLVIFDEDPATTGKRRNYTPDRGVRKRAGKDMGSALPLHTSPKVYSRTAVGLPPLVSDGPSEPGTAPAAEARAASPHTPLPDHPSISHDVADHRGPLPTVKDLEDDAHQTIVPSHAMQTARRGTWLKGITAFLVLLVVGAAIYLTAREHLRTKSRASADVAVDQSSSPVLSNATEVPPGDAAVLEAREFLIHRILPAKSWEDLLPHVRLPETTEQLMRSYYANVPFKPLDGTELGTAKVVENAAGRFAVFPLASQEFSAAMVEIGKNSPKLDWELLVNHPLHEWRRFVTDRPAATENLAVIFGRCYVREDLLTAEERPRREQFQGLRITVPGNDTSLFVALPLDSDQARWVSQNVPWEHENKSFMVRAALAFDPTHASLKHRAILIGEPTLGWNRP